MQSSVVQDKSPSKTIECDKESINSCVAGDTSPSKTMECTQSVISCVTDDKSPSKTMKCGVYVNNSVFQVVRDTVKPGNSVLGGNDDTHKVIPDGSDPIEILHLDKSSKLPDQEIHCYLHSCCNSCTYCVFSLHPQRKGVSPAVEKVKIKPVKHASFVNNLCPSVENVLNGAQNPPVGGCLRDF